MGQGNLRMIRNLNILPHVWQPSTSQGTEGFQQEKQISLKKNCMHSQENCSTYIMWEVMDFPQTNRNERHFPTQWHNIVVAYMNI
jgi:hypothetical protein